MIKIGNKLLNVSVEGILKDIRSETFTRGDMYLKDMKSAGSSILVTCPFHKDHKESKPACGVFTEDTDRFHEGEYHCFACGACGNIIDLVSGCFSCTKADATNWLVDKYGDVFVERTNYLPEITFGNSNVSTFMDPSILNNYRYYHPYLSKRKISEEVASYFDVGYNKNTNSITFPLFDEKHRLVMITERNVANKHFYIERDKNKPVYLLFDLLERGVDTAIVVESQINCLTLRTWGYDSIGLIGTGSKNQYEILKKSGIRNYFLALDGDNAGDKGIWRFIKNMPKDVIINIICIPRGLDVNDLEKEDFLRLEVIDQFEWKKRQRQKQKIYLTK